MGTRNLEVSDLERYKGTLLGDARAYYEKQLALQNYLNQGTQTFQGTGTSIPGNTADFGFKTSQDDGKVDWAKFAMWLRGFLAGIEGKELTPADVGKIMDKLATVDPERKLSYQDLSNWQNWQMPTTTVKPFVTYASPTINNSKYACSGSITAT